MPPFFSPWGSIDHLEPPLFPAVGGSDAVIKEQNSAEEVAIMRTSGWSELPIFLQSALIPVLGNLARAANDT